jgi:hypothetical protein
LPGYAIIGVVDAVGKGSPAQPSAMAGALTVIGGYTEYLYWQ